MKPLRKMLPISNEHSQECAVYFEYRRQLDLIVDKTSCANWELNVKAEPVYDGPYPVPDDAFTRTHQATLLALGRIKWRECRE